MPEFFAAYFIYLDAHGWVMAAAGSAILIYAAQQINYDWDEILHIGQNSSKRGMGPKGGAMPTHGARAWFISPLIHNFFKFSLLR